MATKIILDPGHGGYDSGASYEGRREKDDVLNLAFDVAANLRGLGYEVEFTRTDDVYDSPTEKARIGNASGADYFISLHRNSSQTPNQYEGVETLLYSDTGIKADMARNINDRLEEVGFKDLGVDVRKDLAVLRRTNMPALLLEVGFINNEGDNQLFDSKRAEIAEAIAVGIDETLRAGAATTAMTQGGKAGTATTAMAQGGKAGTATTAMTQGKNADTATSYNADEQGFVNDYYGYRTNMPVFADQMMDSTTETSQEKEQDNQEQAQDEKIIYQILVSLYRNLGMASMKMNQLINAGFDATANEVDGLYQVRVGAFDTVEEALAVQEQLRNKGYDSLIVTYQDQTIM